MKKLLMTLILVLLLAIGGLSFVVYRNTVKGSLRSGSFVIAENSYPRKVFSDLEDKGYINSGTLAYYYSRFLHPSSFKAGKYEIPEVDLPTLIDYLSDSSNIIQDTVSITFIEGDWLKDFAAKIADATNLDAAELIAYWDDEDNVRRWIGEYEFLTDEVLGENVRHPLEGYLFPDTYTFLRETDCETVTKKILGNTAAVYDDLKDLFAENGLSVHEIFTLASIVQYESASAEQMGTISGVFYNRMEIDMPLQSSVTVCYAIDLENDENWTECEYNSTYDDPYNTYLYPGLPPGPIVSPGRDALTAAVRPTDRDKGYFYFIADVCHEGGTVHFARDFAEHQRNVEEYLTCY